jgi:penicillin-binding protein 1A
VPARIWRDYMMRATGAGPAERPEPVLDDVIEGADEVGNLIDEFGNGIGQLPGMVERELDGIGVRVGRDGAIEIDRDRFDPDRRRREEGPPPEEYGDEETGGF